MELFAREVMPALREINVDSDLAQAAPALRAG
jgi:hypothetical protein